MSARHITAKIVSKQDDTLIWLVMKEITVQSWKSPMTHKLT